MTITHESIRGAGVPTDGLNTWFCALPEGRQAVLRDDKWMLANAAFEAGAELAAAQVQPVSDDGADEPTYLCQAWGETDFPAAALVKGIDAVRNFLIEQWLGSADHQNADGTNSLEAAMLEMRDLWEAEGDTSWKWEAEFEIGGVSVQQVADFTPKAASQAHGKSEAVALHPITASMMRDDGGESPTFCVMAAFRTEAEGRAALCALTQRAAAPAADAAVVAPMHTVLLPATEWNAMEFWLNRCEEKGHLDNCFDLVQPWEDLKLAIEKQVTNPSQSTGDSVRVEGGEADLWYLQDTRSFIGNDVVWWAQDGNGYTTDLRQAQAYSREQAFRQAAMRGCDRAWPKAYIDGKSRPAVDFQHIDHDAALAQQAAPAGGSHAD